MESEDQDKVRLDKWLWAARFFKTRGQASEAIAGGKVHVEGQRTKPSRHVRCGDELRIRRGQEEFVIHVRGLSERRGPAPEARRLYEETAASLLQRQQLAEERRLQARVAPLPRGRPSKRERRQLSQLRNR